MVQRGSDGTQKDFDWRYDLEDDPFVCRIIEMAQAVHLWDGGDLSYEDLQRDNPHRAYVIAIEYRAMKIVDRFKSLNVLDRLLSFDALPIATPSGRIFRDEWIRVTLDVLLTRLTSIRDCCYLFVAQVHDLNLEPREVSLGRLQKLLSNRRLKELLTEIGEAARDIRDERDRHLHRGEQRALTGDVDQIFHIMSMMEGQSNFQPRIHVHGKPEEIVMDVRETYKNAMNDIRVGYHQNGDLLIKLTRQLFDLEFQEFDQRWAEKRDTAKDVRDWEGPRKR